MALAAKVNNASRPRISITASLSRSGAELMIRLISIPHSLISFAFHVVMSNQLPPRRRWAESGDWDPVRPLITRMYKVEGRSLKEVMRIMETEHQFLATPKMYKKRIKDWAIDKNHKSERSPRTRQQRDLPGEPHSSSVRSVAIGPQRLRNPTFNPSPGPVQAYQYGTRPPAEGSTQRGYPNHTPGTMQPPQQGQPYWAAGTSQPNSDGYGYGSYHTCPFPQSGHASISEQPRTSPPSSPSSSSAALLSSIRDRFLEASDAITRRDTTADLFGILNPAYEAISAVAASEAGTSTEQLLAAVADLCRLLAGRPDHRDMLRQLLQYVLALVPGAARSGRFLSGDGVVLAVLGQAGGGGGGMPSDTAVPARDHDCCEQQQQATGAGSASGGCWL
ncbi:hypothetical protein KVR01_013158 [Diaporthe batatas]|uniref:uncharacterized protein n=1 Tax=Diaporthe batatas TaxID=748121 RepID=UPI001D045AFC|nr:uncharacterized protein KVR01_013158 [Diaporthe batatas]KAG8156936.1 hypothetical protein KVR01_013158 [Diaporthe batatas]